MRVRAQEDDAAGVKEAAALAPAPVLGESATCRDEPDVRAL